MLELLYSVIFISFGVMGIWTWSFFQAHRPEETAQALPALLLSIWLIASAVWGAEYYSVRLPGLFDFTVDRILFCGILFALAMLVFSDRPYLKYNITPELMMAVFLVLAVGSMLALGFRSSLAKFASPWYLFMNGYLFPFLAYVFAKNYVSEEKGIRVLFHFLFYLGVYLCIVAFLEFFNLRQYIYPRYITDPNVWLHLDRARGPFLNAAFNGLAINIGFICGIHLLPHKSGLPRLIYIGLLTLFFPAVFFTQTRSVYLGFALTIIGFALFYRTSLPKLKVLSLPAVLLIFLFLFNIPNMMSADRRSGGVLQMQEVEERMGLINRSFLMFTESPFLGAGLGRYPELSQQYRGSLALPTSYTTIVQHNHLLGMLVECGMIGTLFYIGMLVTFFRHMYLLADFIPEFGVMGSGLLLCLATGMIIYINNNLFVEPAYFLFVNAVFFTFAGISEGLYNRYALTRG